jgi:phospholipid/cholesterol/gamma-HCH transport system permease protein
LGIIALVTQAEIPPATAATSSASAPASRWQQEGQGWTLHLAGAWRGATAAGVAPVPAAALAAAQAAPGAIFKVDASALQGWDNPLAAALWEQLLPLARARAQIDMATLPEGLRESLDLALPHPGAAKRGAADQIGDAPPGIFVAWWRDALLTVRFFGEVQIALWRLLRGKSDMRGADLLRQLDQTGPLSLPIVALTCALVGLMLAYMGGAQLDRIGAQSYIADVVTVGMVREMAGLMTGVILSGRLGAAFAAQLASMQANEEIDALRAMGVDPVAYLVLPRLIALIVVAPLLVSFASLVGIVAGLPAVVFAYGFPPVEYLYKCLETVTWTHLWIGTFKGTLYAALVALAGCREGLYSGRNAQAVGEATTAAVVKSLVWIVMAASGTTVIFQSLGF